MKHFIVCFALSLVTTGAMSGSVDAQQRTPRRINQASQYEITSGISEALRTLGSDPQAALRILRQLDRRFPGNERVLTRVGYVMQMTGDADSAEVYYRRALSASDRSLEAGKSLGMLLMSTSREREARVVFSQILEANAHGLNAYRTVGSALRDLGRYPDALEIFKQGRDKSNSHFVLTLEIASLHRSMNNLVVALDEYLLYIEGKARNYRFSRTKILEMLRDAKDNDQATLVKNMEQRLTNQKSARYVLLDILSSHFLEQGLLEKSLDMALQADAVKGSDGNILVTLSEQIVGVAEGQSRRAKKRYLELAVRALDAFASNHPKAPGTDRARYMLATIYVEFGSGGVGATSASERKSHLDKAVQAFADLSRRYPNSEYAELAYLDRAEVLMHRLKDPEQALSVYKAGAVNSRRYGDVFAERIADMYLGLGRFDDAGAYFTGLAKSGSPELVRASTYYMGLLLVLEGDYEAGRQALSDLAESDPSSPFTNDALKTAWLVQEALQYESRVLPAFIAAERASLVGDTVTVIANLETVVDQPVYETLRPRALFRLGSTLYSSGDLAAAVAVLERFLKEYPEEDLRPEVHRTIAAIYEYGYEEYEQALRAYEDVLVSYPEYAFLDEVRKDVRRLRFIVEGEEYEN